MVPPNHNEAVNPDSGRENTTSTVNIKTLGLLFVHGIGTQRRGDTLAQCGAAIHAWLREWITQPTIEGGSIAVDLVDTSLTQPRADEPAHSRLIFRKGKIADHSWVLAESCWAEAFRPPRYREFVRWALQVLPITVFLHSVGSFRRNLRILRLGSREELTSKDRMQLQMDLGPRYGSLPTESPALQRFLNEQAARAGTRWFIAPFLLVAFLFVALFVQAILIAVMLVSFLPIGFLRAFAARVQRAVANVLGDSYLFVTSPISASAAVTQVKRDFDWLAERCDQVVILAHSQGAAVAYRAIEEWSWEGKVPRKLKRLITYGAGLRKLFDLQQLSRNRSPEDTFRIRKAGVLAAVGSIGILSLGLWLVGTISLLPFVLSVSVGFIAMMLALFSVESMRQLDPALPVGVFWVDLFASHDPVPNGPVTVGPPESVLVGNVDRYIKLLYQGLVELFHIGQRREVVNLQSIVADHNSYWFARDDFVSRVVKELLGICNIPSPATPDDEWLELSAARRRWRVGLRTRCRNVALLAALGLALWPHEVIEAFGRRVVRALSGVGTSLPGQWIPDWIQGISISEWPYVVGICALLVCITSTFAIAAIGWNMWERREFAHFFRREPYRATGVGLAIFAAGWLGILVVISVVTIFTLGEQAFWPSAWTSTLLLVISGWMIVQSGKGPGRSSSWIPTLLDRGELFLKRENGDKSENLARARGYFSWAAKWTLDRKDSMDRARALLGVAGVLEETEEASEDKIKKLKALYEEAIATLERMGEDTETVRNRLDRLSGEREKIVSRKGT